MVAVASTSDSTVSESHVVPVQLRKTIQSIKEVVGSFSDSDILMALEETNMDPDETTQKLLNQDPFREVKRKRDKKKESMGHRAPVDSARKPENSSQGMHIRAFTDGNPRQGFTRIAPPRNVGISRQFRVVRDNRVNLNTNSQMEPASQGSTLSNERAANEKRSENSSMEKLAGSQSSSRTSNGHNDSQHKTTTDDNKGAAGGRNMKSDEKRPMVLNGASLAQTVKLTNSQHQSTMLPPNNSVVGLYSSSTDPVHVPSHNSRSSASVGAVKRDFGVVGGRRPSSENSVKGSSASSNSFANSSFGRDGYSTESVRPFSANSKSDHVRKTSVTGSVMSSNSVNRPFLTNQYSSRPHQQAMGHQKVPYYKEWKPKTTQKSTSVSPGVIGTPKISSSPTVDNSKGLESNEADLQDKFSQVNIHENQKVIIAQHIRVPETDKCRLTFGSIGVEFDSSHNISGVQAVGATEESNGESATSLSVSALESSGDNADFGNKKVELLDDRVRNSETDSPTSDTASEQQLPEKSLSSSNLENYADIGLVQDSTQPYDLTASQQQQDRPELPTFSAYGAHAGYDLSYFRPPIDETIQGQGLTIPQEVLTSHAVNNLPASSISMVQQQQHPPLGQMYPQLHVSHFANLMPYRQLLPPVFVPQMAMPGYSSNPAYPHPSNGNSYLLMHGANSHLGANGLKYGIQQFKPVPGNSPNGFGNFANPAGYAINASGVVGNAIGLEDSSRMKYKDGNLYAPKPQADTSEIWIQNPRELPNLQSAPYFNMPGQTPHAAFVPSHTGHASFNAASAQSSQFPGLYPPPSPAALPGPHHLGPVMGSNVGVGVAPAAPGAQVGAYQQPQLGHLNWTTNF